MKLLVNGCSHSAGAEILELWHPKCPEQAWGQHLANHFNFSEYVNLAIPGASNQWIHDTTIKFLEDCRDPTEWFVVIGWTNACRLPVYCYEKEQVVHLCPNHRDLAVHSRGIQNAYYHLYSTMLPLQMMIAQEHYRIVGLQMLLKQLGVQYLFFDAVSSNHETMPTRLVDLSRYYRYNQLMNSYWNYFQQHVWDKTDRWANHAPASYHQEWAQQLIEFITQNKLIAN